MAEVAPLSETGARLRAAAERVLQDKSFHRAPVMSRLLKYLIDRSIEGTPVKSYRIATEALGRSESDGADADTYARVAVARLRRALATYHASHPEEDEIFIDSRSYNVVIRDRIAPGLEVDQRGEPAAPRSAGVFRRVYRAIVGYPLRLAAVALVLALVVAGLVAYQDRRDEARWVRSDIPTLAILDTQQVSPGAGASDWAGLDAFGNILRRTMAQYLGFRLVTPGDQPADFEIRLDTDRSGSEIIETVTLVETDSQIILWTRNFRRTDAESSERNAMIAAAAMASPGGALATFGRRRRLGSRTPYGCWLLMTGSVMSYAAREDGDLQRCSQDWYGADEGSRLAAFVRNWTMVDISLGRLSEERRREDLQAALAVIHGALARSPQTGMLYIAEMRTYSFLGMREEVGRSARAALAAAPSNRVVAGMAGTWLTFWSYPEGETVLAGLENDPEVNLPWEQAGFFVAAMMRDDVEAAGQHLSQLRFYLDNQPALAVLEAAHARRAGRPDAAAAALKKIATGPASLVIGPEDIVERMPLAPEVKARLREWLAYSGPIAAQG